jgi:hypothetical protein
MIGRFVMLAMAYFVIGLAEASACTVPYIRTLAGVTVDGYMTVRSGKRCSIVLNNSAGPTQPGADVVQRPSHGSLSVAGYRVVYASRPGFVGSDSFTYARRGLGAGSNRPVVRTVRVAVTVKP